MKFVQKWSEHRALLIGTLGGLLLGGAWCFPGSLSAAMLGWLAATALVVGVALPRQSILALTCAGLTAYVVSASWFYEAVQTFTRTTTFSAALLTSPFLIWQILPFVLFGVFFRLLPPLLSSVGIRAAIAWAPIEWIWPTLFPWRLGDTQLGLQPFAQIAEFVGSNGLSFVMLWFAECAYGATFVRFSPKRLIVAAGLMCAILAVGSARAAQVGSSSTDYLRIGIVQARGSAHDSTVAKLLRYSESLVGRVDLLVWPERALRARVHESIGHRDNDSRLSELADDAPLIAGVQTYRPPRKVFNSVMLIQADGEIPVPYHKRVLMPFGEYLPIPHLFKFLGVSSLAPPSVHAAGKTPTVFDVRIANRDEPVKIAPLICYEDLVPELSVLATSLGADLLLDIAAGEWSTSELALRQHQTLAAFRAIEVRRSVLRVSSRGPSAVIDPTGKVQTIFKVGEEGAKVIDVPIKRVAAGPVGFREYFSPMLGCLLLLSVLSEVTSSARGLLRKRRVALT